MNKEPFFLIMNRGKCSFVTKVLHAEKMGAVGAIIVDSHSNFNWDSLSVIMADDGRGNLVHIPSMMISHKNGKIIED